MISTHFDGSSIFKWETKLLTTWYVCDNTKLSSAAAQEKRGHRESRLLENLNKMALETNEQMLPTTLEGMNQQLSDVTKRCKPPLSDSHLRLLQAC